MKFWLGYIAIVILFSSALTWLVMHQGAQAEGQFAAVNKDARPEVVFENVDQSANVINLDAGPSYLDQDNSVAIGFKNQGKDPLTIELLGTSCGCVHQVKVDETILQPRGQPAQLPPGGSGKIIITWRPGQEQMDKGGTFRFTADLLFNDPRPQYANPVRVEVKTQLRQRQAGG